MSIPAESRKYDASNLILRAGNSTDPNVLVEVTPQQAGWETIHFQARRLAAGESWSFSTGAHELALVVLGGRLGVQSNRGQWSGLGERAQVFAGLPYALYLSLDTDLRVTAETDCQFGVAWVAADRAYPPCLITPARVAQAGVEIRGGDNATRQINSLLPPGFPCQRLVVVEVYTPGGNWSSYPPHKHDVHRLGPEGQVLEADLDEIYYYKIDRPEGYALQRVYTGLDSPLQRRSESVV